uniref:Uncharacterized protein n=1 Tax=viral metagenome TaxID=1070528 RepID=A0A6C0BZJ3_9ZZZZ
MISASNNATSEQESTRPGVVIASVLFSIVLVLFVCRTLQHKLLQRLPKKVRGESPVGRIALALVGTIPTDTVYKCRLTEWMKSARWPTLIVCYGATTTAMSQRVTSVPFWPLRLLSSSTCDLAVVIPWDIDLGEGWDEKLHGFMPRARDVCYSFYVPGSQRLYHRKRAFSDCSPPPQLIVPSQKVSLRIPDFRCVVAKPHSIASYAENWFPSFFAGLLVYPLRTQTPAFSLQSSAFALDPLPGTGVSEDVTLTTEDASTLLALGISEKQRYTAPLHGDIWDVLLLKPPVYIRLPSNRKTLNKIT